MQSNSSDTKIIDNPLRKVIELRIEVDLQRNTPVFLDDANLRIKKELLQSIKYVDIDRCIN